MSRRGLRDLELLADRHLEVDTHRQLRTAINAAAAFLGSFEVPLLLTDAMVGDTVGLLVLTDGRMVRQ